MQKFKLRTVFIGFVAAALVLLTLVSTLINVKQFSGLYYGQTEKEYLPNSVGRIAEQVRAELMPAIILSDDMSNNSMLHDWMTGGEEAGPQHDQVLRYFKQQRANAHANTLFWVSGLSNTYYTDAGAFKKISTSDPRDNWYYNFLKSGAKQSLLIEPVERTEK